MQLADLLIYDEKPECYNSFYKDFNVWFYIRDKIFCDILSKENNVELVTTRINQSKYKKIKFIILSFLFRIPSKRKAIVFFSSNVVNMKREGVYENRLYDYFFKQKQNESILIEDCYNLEYRRPRSSRVYYTGIVQLQYKFKLLFSKNKNYDLVQLSKIIDEIKTIFIDFFTDEYWNEINQIVYNGFCFFEYARNYYSKLFNKIKPKIVFREDASYGHYQYLSVVCKEKNIIFGEFQHGCVAMDHVSYNFGKTFFENAKLKELLPSYYLMFGQYWGSQIKHPAEKQSVGFPYLQQKKNNNDCKQIILIVSDGDSPNQNKTLINYISEYAKDQKLTIILKLHPCEYPKLQEWYGELLDNQIIQIKVFEPVYDYISKAKYVIGSGSTVMYETFAFGIMPFVYESKRFLGNQKAKEIFNTFSTKEELLDLVNGKTQIKKVDVNYFFDKNWEKSYIKFINEVVFK